jgi:ArsR family transcriptional regulator, arsenate/arsenite/antimonite-responsive transcriptional repressor
VSGDKPDIGALFRRSQALLSALGDQSRQEIVTLLLSAPEPTPVNDIAARVGLSQPAVSHHLRILKEAGIVSVERSGKQRLYSVSVGPDTLAPLADLVAGVRDCLAAAGLPVRRGQRGG